MLTPEGVPRYLCKYSEATGTFHLASPVIVMNKRIDIAVLMLTNLATDRDELNQ